MSESFNDLKDLLNYATPEEKQMMLNKYPELKYDYNEVQDILNYATPEERTFFENKYPDLKPEAGYGEVLFNTPAGALAQTGQSTGGIIRAAEELLGTGTKLGESIADESLLAAGQLANEMNLQPDTWKNTIYGGVTSAAQQVPLIVATGFQPELAPLTLATMGAISGGQRYDEARRENYTPGQALLQGAAYGVAEAAGEYIPLGTLLDKTGVTPKAMATKLIKYIAQEEGSELGTEVMQWATDKLAKDITANKDANYQDLMPRLIETAKATLISAPILGGAGTLANAHLQNRELQNSIPPESIPGNEELKQLGDNLNLIENMTPEQEAELVKQALSENQPEQTQPIEPEPIQQPEAPETDSQAINNITELNNEAQANTQELKQDADEAINILQNAQEPQQATQPITEQTNTPLVTEPPANVSESNENVQPVSQEMPVNDINIHDDIQYKRNVDKNKVTNKLKGRVYNPQLAGAIDVFVNPEDGKTYVWNGHHRLQLAKENGVENVKVIYSKFNNPQEAKEAGLLKNLAEENGEPLDYRNFFKQKSIENKQQAIDFLKNKGIDVNKGLAEKGFALSQLSDYLTNEYEKGVLPENLATEIGKQLPKEADQNALYNHLKKVYFDNDKTITTNKLKDLIEFAKSAPKQTGEMDLFGDTEETNRLDIKSNISEFILKQIKNNKNLFKKLSNEDLAEAATKIGGIIDTAKASPEQQREALAEFNFKRRMFAAGDPISSALNEATQQVIDGQPEGKVKANTYMTIKNILEENNDVENSSQTVRGINEGQGSIGQNQQGIGEQQQSGNAPAESMAQNSEIEQKVYKIEQIKTIQDLINNQRNIADTRLTSVIDDKTAAINYKGKDYTVTETPAGLKFDEIFQAQPKAKQEGLFEEDKTDIEREQEAAQNTDDLFNSTPKELKPEIIKNSVSTINVKENNPIKSQDEIDQMFGQGEYAKGKTLTGLIYNHIKDGQDFQNKNELKNFAKENGHDITDLRKLDEAYEAAKVRQAQEVYAENKNDDETLLDKFDEFTKKQLKNNRRSDTVNDLQQFSTPVNIAALANLILDKFGAKMVLEPTAGNGGLLLNSERGAIVNELDKTRFENVKTLSNVKQAFNENAFESGYDKVIEASKNNGVDAVVANPPFGIGKTQSGEPREFRIIKDALEKTGVEKGVFIIGDAHPFTERPNANNSHLTRIGGKVFEANNKGRIAEYTITGKREVGNSLVYILKNNRTGEETKVLKEVLQGTRANGNRFFIDTPISNKMADFFDWLYSNYNVKLNEPVLGSEYKTGGTEYPTRIIAVDGKNNGNGPAFNITNIERQNKTVKEIYNKFKEGVVNDNGSREQLDGRSERQPAVRVSGRNDNVLDRPENNVTPVNSPIVNGSDTVKPEQTDTGKLSKPMASESSLPSNERTESERNDTQRNDEPVSGQVTNDGTRNTNDNSTADIGRVNDEPRTPKRNDESVDAVLDNGASRTDNPIPDGTPAGRTGSGTGQVNGEVGGSNEQRTDSRRDRHDNPNEAIQQLESNIIDYKPHSQNTVYGGLKVPANIANETDDAITRLNNKLKKQGHTFTSYVASKIGISESALTRSDKPVLTAEQVESVALTINNIETGEQTIIGHDTGTGKGRIGACVLSYAVKTLKKTPVFFTLSPGLGTDILRDLMDVHDFGGPGAKVEDFLKQFNILSINVLTNSAAGEERSKLLVYNPLDRSQALATPQKISPKNLTADNLKAVMKKGNYNIIFSTYSQFANDFQKEGARYDAIMPFIENGIIVLDEVHKAAGVMDDNTVDVVEGAIGPRRRTKKGNEVKATTTSNTFLNMAPFIAKAKAPVLLSATFSKRANTLPIFLWRDRAKYNIEDLHKTIQSLSTGGATSLEYVTRALTQEGKYLRMEKDYEGVQVFSEDIKYDNPTKVNNVIDTVAKVFQTITRLNADLKEAMPQTRKAGALNLENSGFSSVLHNYLGQVLFAVRTDAVGKKVADLIKQGKKVVLGFENTMESIVTELYGEPKDEKLDNDLSHIFLNVLNKHVLTREISENEEETDLNGKTKVKKGQRTKIQIGHAYVDDNGDIEIELDRRDSTPAMQEMKKEILDCELRTDEDGATVTVARTLLELNDFLKNKKMGYSISPIDAMKRAIAKYMGDGYSINRIGEFTGREFEIDADNVYKKKKAESSNSIINKFNEGTKDNPLSADAAYDVVFLNKKGSTGISLHNDPRFGTAVFGPKGKERVMIIAQPLADPNDMMQLLGRIHRYGQLTPPTFYLLNTGLPGETRANSSFLSKLKSLNASISADRAGGQFDFKGADVFNIVGDQVMLEFLSENPEYARYMGFTVEENEAQGETTIKEDEENLCSRTFGKIATLTRKQQEDFLTDFMTKYNNVIDNLNAFGKNPLASTITKLDAKLLHKEVVLKATGDNPFEACVDRYIIEGNNLLKPVQIAELEKEAARNKKEAAEILPKIIEKAQQSLAFLKHKADIIADPETSRRKLMLYEKNKEKLNDITSQVEFLINNIGKMVSMATEEGPAKGILVDVHFTPAMHTPYAKDAYEKPLTFKPGNVKIRIYENNVGEKTFMLKNVSKDITGENNYRLKQEHESWDKNINKNQREVRDFYAGNMLRLKEVFGENQPGGIITKINMDNGDIIPGFLINKESTTINSENWQDKIKEKPLGNIGDGNNYYFKKHNVSDSAKRTYGDDYKSRNNSETPYEIKAGKYLAGLNRLEIVRIAETLAAIPEIRKRLKPGVLGMFNDKTGKIKINAAELKNSDIDEITKVIAHEIGHLIDWKEGKIPETLTRGNILGHIGALGHFMKSTLNIDPMGQPPYLSTKQRQKIYRETWKKVLNSAEYYESDMDPKIFRSAYAEEIAKYITDNNLIHKEIIIGELLNLTQHYANISNEDINNDFSAFWKGFEYYSNPAELYANAMGALLTNPAMLGNIAPTAANMIYNHMKNKPATLKLYNYFQNKINSGDRYKENLNYLRQRMINADVKQSEEMSKRSEKQSFKDWVMTTFMDRLYPVLKYASIAPGSESSFEIMNKAQKLRSITDICEEYLKSFAPKIAKLIKDYKIDLTDLGLRAFFTRVVEERSQEGVIDITDEQLAQELNDELESQYSPEQVAAMDEIFKTLRDARQPLIDKLVGLGIYGKKLIEKLKDNKNYFTFDIVEHYDKEFGAGNVVSGKIQKQIGTLKATANPFISTIIKDIALTRTAIEMDFTKSALKFLGEKGVNVQKAQTVDTERGPKNLSPKASSNLGLVEVLENDELKGYYVPKDIAETLNNPSMETSVGLQYLSALNHIPRTLFTSASIGFIVSNAIRDSIGSFLKLPHTLSNFGTFGKLYLREFKNALLNTQSEEKVNNLLSKGIIYGDRPMNFQPDPEITPWENQLRKFGLSQTITDFNETNASKYARFLNTLMGTVEYLANPILNLSGRIEKASKIAGYDYLQAIKNKYGISENEIDMMVTELVGTPNAKRKGTFTPYMNNLMLFSNVMLQGYKAHATALKMNKTEYLTKLATVSMAPVLLMALCATGDDKEWWEKVSPYHKQNYNIIPLYWLGGSKYDKNGKALYLTLPKEELSRAISSTFWQAINPQNGSLRETLTSIFNAWGGEIPKSAPAITAAVDTLSYARGFNPYDSFRQQNVINPRTFDKQDFETDKAFATYILNLFGMNTLYKIDTTAKKNEPPKDTVDSLSGGGWPSVYGFNVGGRFLKASDAGERSAINDLKKDVKAEQARELDLVDSALNKMFGDNKNAKITPEETEAMRKHPDYRKKQIERYRNPDRASIKEAPKAIRQEVKKILNF